MKATIDNLIADLNDPNKYLRELALNNLTDHFENTRVAPDQSLIDRIANIEMNDPDKDVRNAASWTLGVIETDCGATSGSTPSLTQPPSRSNIRRIRNIFRL